MSLIQSDRRRRLVVVACLGAFAALGAGCAGLGPVAEQPRVSIADLGFVDAGILEQHFKMKLRIQNPAPVDLAVTGVDVRVELNGKLFMTGLGHDTVAVPALGTATVEVDAFSTLTGLVRQFNAFAREDRKTLSYRMQGVLYLGESRRRARFDDTGEIDWPASPGT